VAKETFSIRKISKQECGKILMRYHYLKDISKGFKSGFNYGLFNHEECCGVVIYTGFPVPELATGMLGLKRDDQEGLFELSRLCLTPEIQKQEHNLASWFVSKTIKLLRADTKVRVVLSYADADHHKGTVYRAANFGYYGMSAAKKDFWIEQEGGNFVKHSRGTVKGLKGEWRPRSRKHRFALVFDKSLKILWSKE